MCSCGWQLRLILCPANSRRVVLSASSTWSFFACCVARDLSRSSSCKQVSSEGKLMFSEVEDLIISEVGEGNSDRVTASGSPDKTETE